MSFHIYQASAKELLKVENFIETLVHKVLVWKCLLSFWSFWSALLYTHVFYKQRFFSTQPKFCWTFSRIELQMLLGYCLIHRSIWDAYYILCPCLELSLFMSYLCDLFFIFIFIFITINRIISWIQKLAYFWEYVLLFLDDDVMKNVNNFQISKVQPQGVA